MQIPALRSLAAALFLLVASFGTTPATAMGLPATGSLHFTVLRDGDEIGDHVMRFGQSQDGLDVQIRTRIVVKVAFVPVYRFEHDGRELWRDGRLAWMQSKTNDDGDRHALSVQATADHLAVVDNGGASSAPLGIVPASLWNEAVLKSDVLLNTLNGKQMSVGVADAGYETLDLPNRRVTAHHYRITGGLEREVWYDPDGVLVHVRFQAKDGSRIDYRLR